MPFNANGAAANQIQELITDGIEVGSGGGANSSTGGDYRGFVLKEGNTQEAVTVRRRL